MNRFRLRLTTALTAATVLATGGAVWLGTAPASAAAAAGAKRAVHTGRAGKKWHREDVDSRTLLKAPLAPSVPSDPAIFGLAPGAVPWVIRSGHVRLSTGGALRAEVRGLVVPATGKNPLPQIAAVVYCNGTAAAMTTPVSFSPKGNASLRAKVTLPAFCAAPAVVLEPASGGTMHNMYIAFDGKAS